MSGNSWSYLPKKITEVKEMTEKKLNDFTLYEIDGEYYSLEEIKAFITNCNEHAKRNEELSKENYRLLSEHRDLTNETNFLKRQISALKFRCSDLSKRNTELETEIEDMKFTRKYLTSEEAGKRFAQELLGGT